ncbi:CotO family spore coat protein [Bacillus sp. FJAT-52991]|uniref:CotO family spore coat protein n=1 Tax=Bacillus kandeliae TaxID=3129297 RepID=A0ABZ2N8J7_9BACI
MKKKQEKREPLMYIQQPSLHSPEASMQQSFHTKNVEIKDEEQKKKRRKEHRFVEKWDIEEEVNEKVKEGIKQEQSIEKSLEEKTKPSWLGIKPVKSFQKMTMDEKLGHLSTQFIPFPCEFICKDQSYRGILKEWTNKKIKIKSFKEEIVMIDRADLKHIRIIGPS